MAKKLSYVVGIQEPEFLRKQLLESARDTIEVLKEKKQLSELRKTRRDKTAELHKVLKHMHKSLSKLHSVLPEQNQVPRIAKQQEEKKSSENGAQHVSELSSIKGIGPSRVKKLSSIGIKSIRELAHASVADLQKIGIVPGTAKKLIEAAHIKDAPAAVKAKVKPAPVKKVKTEMDILEEKLSAIESKLKNL